MVLNYMLTVKTHSYSVRAFSTGKALDCELVNKALEVKLRMKALT